MYEYTDNDGSQLRINRFYGSRVGNQVYVRTPLDGVYVGIDEAPDAALALLASALEASGEPASDKVAQAITLLEEHEQERARKKAEEEELWATAIRLRLAYMNGLDWDRARRELIDHDDIRDKFFRMARSVRDNYQPRPEAPDHAEHCAGLHSSGYCPPRIHP